MRVRNRTDGKASLRAINDLGVRDFYTAVNKSASLDSSLESLLSAVEGGAAKILRQHLDFRSFVRPRAFTPEERAILDTFVAMQAVRGMRVRRSLEVLADYTIKLLNQDKLTDEDVHGTDFLPHPNEHLSMFGSLAERAEEILKSRPVTFIHLDKPLLIIGDEPVLVENDDDDSGQARNPRPNTSTREFVHFEGRVGLADAEMIMLAISPSVVLVYGPADSLQMPMQLELTGEDAESFADEHNKHIIETAVDWVAASPDHAAFASMNMPPPHPILAVHDYGSSAAARVNSTPARRPVRRVRPDDALGLVSGEESR